MKLLRSADNPIVKRIARLIDSPHARSNERSTVLEGSHLLSAWQDADRPPPEMVLVRESDRQQPEIVRLIARTGSTPITVLADGVFGRLSAVAGSGGILAVVTPQSTDAGTLVGSGGFQLWLDGIQDPGNVGTLVRTAAAAGATGVVLGPGCADGWAPKTLRAGMGGQFVTPMATTSDLAGLVTRFPGRVLGAGAADGVSVFDVDLTQPTAVVLGSEGAGVSGAVAGRVHGWLRIPMAGAVESLNVAAAGAVISFERLRQVAAVARTAR
ncbi:MAG: RNA methyltransferase [Burkholderiales bacterium]|nr:RNA methyltransferase [Burkholderiales bacterium]